MFKAATILIVLIVITLLFPSGAFPSSSGDDYEFEFTGTVTDELDKIDVDNLSEKVSMLLDKYKFSGEDVEHLTNATMSFISTVNDYAKKTKATEQDKEIAVPHDELREYCSELEKFLKKYDVTVEDTLDVGRAVAFVAMSIKQELAVNKEQDGSSGGSEDAARSIASKEDIDGVFLRLKEFSKSHSIMACDFVPVIYRLSDIGLTFLQNKVDLKKVKKSGGRWRKRLYDLGVSKEQADGLYDALLAFVYKYKISLGEIQRLSKDINKLLKAKQG